MMKAEERANFLRDNVEEQAGDFLHRMAVALYAWLEKRRSRLTLLELTDDQLRDIGLTHDDVKAEASKSWFWRD